MIKTFCDKCENEIQKNELMGQVSYLEREFPLSSSTSTSTSTDDNIPPKLLKIKKTTKILCERCITKIRKHI